MTDQIKISPKFAPLWESDARYYIITGGRGSMKSFTVGLNIVARSFIPHTKILFTRYTLTSAEISIIPEYEEKIELLNADPYFDVHKKEVVNKHTGNQILFRGIKTSSGVQTANLKSIQGVSDWILDEAEELTDETTFDKINLSIRNNKVNNRVILIMNPATKEHFVYNKFFEERGIEPGTNGVFGDTAYIHTTYLDNLENLPDDFKLEARRLKATNPLRYYNVMLGGWLDKADGVVYTNWEFGIFNKNLQSVYGLDFGFTVDPDALVQVAVDKKKKIIYAKELLYKNGIKIEALTDILKVKTNGVVIADSQEQRLIDHLKGKGIHIKGAEKGPGSVKAGILLIQDYKLIIEGENLAKELNNYKWNDKKSGIPIDNYNHLLDSLRYAVSWLLKPRKKSSGKVFLIK